MKQWCLYLCGNTWQLSNTENSDNLDQKTPLVILFLTIYVYIAALKGKWAS